MPPADRHCQAPAPPECTVDPQFARGRVNLFSEGSAVVTALFSGISASTVTPPRRCACGRLESFPLGATRLVDVHMCVHEPRMSSASPRSCQRTCRRVDTLDLAILNDERSFMSPWWVTTRSHRMRPSGATRAEVRHGPILPCAVAVLQTCWVSLCTQNEECRLSMPTPSTGCTYSRDGRTSLQAAWIGTSFYFIFLNNSIRPPDNEQDDGPAVKGVVWMVHGGAFYRRRSTTARRTSCQTPCTGQVGGLPHLDLGIAMLALIYWVRRGPHGRPRSPTSPQARP